VASKIIKYKLVLHVRKRNIITYRRKERNNTLKTKRNYAKWIRHLLCRNGLLKHIIEGNIEGRSELKVRRGRKHKQLLDNFIKKEYIRNWKGKHQVGQCDLFALEGIIDLSEGRLRNERMNEWINKFIYLFTK